LMWLFMIVPFSHVLTLEEYENLAKQDTTGMYRELNIQGVSDGLRFANAFLESRAMPPLFCLPERLAVIGQNLLQILKEAVEKSNKARGIDKTQTLPELRLCI